MVDLEEGAGTVAPPPPRTFHSLVTGLIEAKDSPKEANTGGSKCLFYHESLAGKRSLEKGDRSSDTGQRDNERQPDRPGQSSPPSLRSNTYPFRGDPDSQLDLEKQGLHDGAPNESPVQSSETITSSNHRASHSSDQREHVNLISFEYDDPEDPNNWPALKKLYAVFVASLTVVNSTISSSLASGAEHELSSYFHVTNEEQLVLPTSIFLVGYCVGPILWGPLSESYGRKVVMLTAFSFFSIWTLGCALAPSFAAFNVFRLLVGIFGSCPISVVGGICADVYHDPTHRGRALSIFMGSTVFGPLFGPIISGFISVITWRWSFWVALILAGATFVPLIFMPETYGPILLKRRAKKLRQKSGNDTIHAPIEYEKTNISHIITVVLYRPIRMFLREWLVLFSCLYTAFVYAIFYVFLQSYPIIYENIYHFNAGLTGLTFLPIGIGSVIAIAISLTWDSILQRAQHRGAQWTRREEARRLPLAFIAGPCVVVALFWTGWAARSDVHWMVPILAGIPFGTGYLLIFMALLNYIVDAYEKYAASASAAASTSRSIFGAVLPFAATPMYTRLGVPWACSLLGFVAVAMCLIPFAFWRFGDTIRERSKFCQELKKEKLEEEEKAAAAREAREAGQSSIDLHSKAAGANGTNREAMERQEEEEKIQNETIKI